MMKLHYLIPIIFLLTTPAIGCGGKGSSKSSKSKYSHLWEYRTKFSNFYSEKDDIKIGDYVMNLQIKEFKKKDVGIDLPKHRALRNRIQRVVKRIALVSDKPNFPYEVHIFDRPDIVNAYCLPGGKIGVFTGLFDKEKGFVDPKNNSQIAAVIGHEIAHATLRHVTRRLTRLQTWGFLGMMASIAIGQGVGGQAQYAFNQVFSLGTNLYLPGYSRKYERAADKVGFYYMSKARYNPQAAIDIWKKAAAKGGRNTKKTHFFASHPASGVRAKNLERWLPEATLIYKGKLKK